ncbi:hypothetical protein CPB84DRAFT_1752837 [Gymnopilus junonius]|uniref:Uncharacterized protein n=1 Tax=Gymnopilus junonius TaxID=109634 RepID=A0A9P5NB23_GYMJU|nr:hypothetical protein CPB84DRAFT_1752837 [Gymnopilus junonius]
MDLPETFCMPTQTAALVFLESSVRHAAEPTCIPHQDLTLPPTFRARPIAQRSPFELEADCPRNKSPRMMPGVVDAISVGSRGYLKVKHPSHCLLINVRPQALASFNSPSELELEPSTHTLNVPAAFDLYAPPAMLSTTLEMVTCAPLLEAEPTSIEVNRPALQFPLAGSRLSTPGLPFAASPSLALLALSLERGVRSSLDTLLAMAWRTTRGFVTLDASEFVSSTSTSRRLVYHLPHSTIEQPQYSISDYLYMPTQRVIEEVGRKKGDFVSVCAGIGLK